MLTRLATGLRGSPLSRCRRLWGHLLQARHLSWCLAADSFQCPCLLQALFLVKRCRRTMVDFACSGCARQLLAAACTLRQARCSLRRASWFACCHNLSSMMPRCKCGGEAETVSRHLCPLSSLGMRASSRLSWRLLHTCPVAAHCRLRLSLHCCLRKLPVALLLLGATAQHWHQQRDRHQLKAMRRHPLHLRLRWLPPCRHLQRLFLRLALVCASSLTRYLDRLSYPVHSCA